MREHQQRTTRRRTWRHNPPTVPSDTLHAFSTAPSSIVLVAIDGSPSAAEALRVTARVAGGSTLRVVVCHVVAPSISTFDGRVSLNRARQTALREGKQVLAEARTALGAVSAEFELLEGDPPQAICRRADQLGCDLVVVGSRDLGRIDRLLTRSVSSAVVGRAPCSVLVARLRRPLLADHNLPAPGCAHRQPAVQGLNVSVVDPSCIRRGMDVYAYSERMGRVKDVDADGFLLDRPWRRDIWLSLECVIAVAADTVLMHRGFQRPARRGAEPELIHDPRRRPDRNDRHRPGSRLRGWLRRHSTAHTYARRLLAGRCSGGAVHARLRCQLRGCAQLAEIGVILLMFGVGIHFSFGDLIAVRAHRRTRRGWCRSQWRHCSALALLSCMGLDPGVGNGARHCDLGCQHRGVAPSTRGPWSARIGAWPSRGWLAHRRGPVHRSGAGPSPGAGVPLLAASPAQRQPARPETR